ncbi:glycosyl hydrolase family 28 protein [Sphingobium sp. BYY-5]|uniref:glycosyl hydrolase family 28 protein n=1 Tax=Sphingobium sp. BYY-5 TaxID=2926400 RepID=UPI001FA75B2D|nr:glycosyl hydrolase family 28 protein [Sphingobium sp. BYY-5]MCI4588746.1 glycosyl hydrolase family 28 protein [Sphingobium sp. BYY-5]
MTRKITLRLVTAVSLAAIAPAVAARPIVYDNPPSKALYTYHDDSFTVRVRAPGGKWQDLYEYRVMVDLDNPQPASMVTFGMDGPVEVAVQKNNGDVRRVEIRPGSKGVQARLEGNIAYFTLARPANLSVEFDGDRLHNLHLFANPVEPPLPDRADPNLVYFGPGIHELPEGQTKFPIGSNKTVYVAGGAIVKGQIDISNASNVRLIGHGILEGGKEGISVLYSRDVTIDGPVVLNPQHYTVMCGQSSGLTIRNLKTFSAGSWTDGLDMMSCSDVTIDDVFLRTSDDAIAIYADRWDYHGDARNYRVTNSTLWADVAHPINIGLHGSKDEPRVIENLTFRNIDILGHDEDDRNYQGAMAITDGDNNLVRNILFEDIRIDSIEEGMLFNFRVVFNEKYSLAPGCGIENVTVRNARFKGGIVNPAVVAGYAADRAVHNVTIEDFRVGATPLGASDVEVGAFVKDFRLRP